MEKQQHQYQDTTNIPSAWGCVLSYQQHISTTLEEVDSAPQVYLHAHRNKETSSWRKCMEALIMPFHVLYNQQHNKTN